MPYADAHSHLHDPRLAPHLDTVLRRARDADVACIHTAATCEADWPATAAVPGHCLLETDAPDMPPPGVPFSEPSQIPSTAALWAYLLSLPLSTFAAQTTAAFLRVFS